MKIQEIDKNVRPREKAQLKGFDGLSDEELLAIILGKGVKEKNAIEVARSLLDCCRGFTGLFKSDMAHLCSFLGIGKVKAIELLAIAEITRRAAKETLPSLKRPTSEEIFKAYAPSVALLEKETVVLLLFDRSGSYQGERSISIGTEDSVTFSHLEILRTLLRSNAHYFYLLHNHPSGDPLPSKGEVSDTLRLKEEAEELFLYLIDHIIISKNRYFSFSSNQLFDSCKERKTSLNSRA